MWEENYPVFLVFTKMATQWRTGFNGPTGFDYNVIQWLFKIHGIEDECAALNDIRVMESAALAEIAEGRESG